jgi:hypothetical protein
MHHESNRKDSTLQLITYKSQYLKLRIRRVSIVASAVIISVQVGEGARLDMGPHVSHKWNYCRLPHPSLHLHIHIHIHSFVLAENLRIFDRRLEISTGNISGLNSLI